MKKIALPANKNVIYLVAICLALILIEFCPTFVVLDIHPPLYDANDWLSDWDNTVYSILEYGGRYSIWHRDAYVDPDDAGAVSVQSIMDYFDQELEKRGWFRSQLSVSCDIFFSQYQLLDYVEGSEWRSYERKKIIEGTEYYQGDFICVAVWPSENHEYFEVDLTTARPSPLLKLISLILSQ